MAIQKLTDKKIKAIRDEGRYADGGGLYLRVRKGVRSLSKSWVLLVQRDGVRREIALGPYGDGASEVSLAEARKRANIERAAVEQGAAAGKARRASIAAGKPTFGQLVEQELPTIVDGLRNEKHKGQWRSTLESYCTEIWNRQIDDIQADDIRKCLAPIWHTKQDTAERLRSRIRRIFASAVALRHRPDNPAAPDALDPLLGKQADRTVKHHPALPYDELPEFWAKGLGPLTSVSADMVRLAILTVTRSGEVRGARWSEIDLDSKLWTIPAERMKAKKEHVIPLSRSAIHILRKNKANEENGGLVFVSAGHGKGKTKREQPMLSENAGRELLLGLRENVSLHGFRSTFSDWAGEETEYSSDTIERCLAHVVGNKVARAYRRMTEIERRREVMDAWERFVTSGIPATAGAAAIRIGD